MTPPTWPMSSGLQGQDFHGPRTQGFMAQGGRPRTPRPTKPRKLYRYRFSAKNWPLEPINPKRSRRHYRSPQPPRSPSTHPSPKETTQAITIPHRPVSSKWTKRNQQKRLIDRRSLKVATQGVILTQSYPTSFDRLTNGQLNPAIDQSLLTTAIHREFFIIFISMFDWVNVDLSAVPSLIGCFLFYAIEVGSHSTQPSNVSSRPPPQLTAEPLTEGQETTAIYRSDNSPIDGLFVSAIKPVAIQVQRIIDRLLTSVIDLLVLKANRRYWHSRDRPSAPEGYISDSAIHRPISKIIDRSSTPPSECSVLTPCCPESDRSSQGQCLPHPHKFSDQPWVHSLIDCLFVTAIKPAVTQAAIQGQTLLFPHPHL
ncbi:hypothetical protein PGT21_001226 [Puccinia graminis f. sp. tritici]|uniref:Uncharacterized protein n=1 Tax=Puccinia graminis f. sp. tritici TaxID=56615 RepID=A0A5B0M9S9_PUCGR|nr:hypothetical protein PGT21_001226 [Puccinia graminis f. sp. tritici]